MSLTDLQANIPIVASATGATHDGIILGASGVAPGGRIKAVYLYPNAAVSADASNYRDISLVTAAGTLSVWSTKTGEEGALTQGTAVEMVLDSTVSKLVAAGGYVRITTAHSGTGVALDLVAVVVYERA